MHTNDWAAWHYVLSVIKYSVNEQLVVLVLMNDINEKLLIRPQHQMKY